jgi:hypothetical protein
MKSKYLSLIIIGSLFCLAACKNESAVTPPPPNKPIDTAVDVYVSGSLEGVNQQAAYWKNGVLNQLTQSPAFANANGIAVHGNDVYVVGLAISANIVHAVYWKNGVITTLSSLTKNSSAAAIAFQGNDMYVVGSDSSRATIWKNGVPTFLPHGYAASAIAINGTDVYVAGYTQFANKDTAAYWKNGIITRFPEGSIANAIATNGIDLYMGGTASNGVGMYWKNGIGTQLPNGVPFYSTINGIAANSTDVFMIGTTPFNGNGLAATFWKDNAPTVLSAAGSPDATPLNNSAKSICLYGSDVYLTSQVIDKTNSVFASYYWKNGVPTRLSDGGSKGVFASGITVVPKSQ